MKYLKTYELKPFRTNLKSIFNNINESYKSFIINDLYKECKLYNINLLDLIKEITLDKKITFQCNWCYDNNIEDMLINSHNVIGICKKIGRNRIDSDILIQIEGENVWHTLFISHSSYKYKIRIYNYNEGPLINKLNMLKNMEKYNL